MGEKPEGEEENVAREEENVAREEGNVERDHVVGPCSCGATHTVLASINLNSSRSNAY